MCVKPSCLLFGASFASVLSPPDTLVSPLTGLVLLDPGFPLGPSAEPAFVPVAFLPFE